MWRWRPSEEVQEDPADTNREPLYRELLAGRPALDTLRELDAELS